MSAYNRKGFVALPARTEAGEVKFVPIKIGSPAHKRYLRGLKKWKRDRLENNRNFKNMLKTTKRMQQDNTA